MISSAEEFISLRNSDLPDEQQRASQDSADVAVWLDTIDRFPEYKSWVAHNKTIPIEVLEILAHDKDAGVREKVARKRKINDKIFNLLSIDRDESVRYTLMCNTKLTNDQKKLIRIEDSTWLKTKLEEVLNQPE